MGYASEPVQRAHPAFSACVPHDSSATGDRARTLPRHLLRNDAAGLIKYRVNPAIGERAVLDRFEVAAAALPMLDETIEDLLGVVVGDDHDASRIGNNDVAGVDDNSTAGDWIVDRFYDQYYTPR